MGWTYVLQNVLTTWMLMPKNEKVFLDYIDLS